MNNRHDNHRDQPLGPDLLMAYLSYALDDVRAFSARGAIFLTKAIHALAEDIPSKVTRGNGSNGYSALS